MSRDFARHASGGSSSPPPTSCRSALDSAEPMDGSGSSPAETRRASPDLRALADPSGPAARHSTWSTDASTPSSQRRTALSTDATAHRPAPERPPRISADLFPAPDRPPRTSARVVPAAEGPRISDRVRSSAERTPPRPRMDHGGRRNHPGADLRSLIRPFPQKTALHTSGTAPRRRPLRRPGERALR